MKIELGNTVFVFDLDDTLYKESDYHNSGVRAVSNTIKKVYGFDATPYLNALIESGETDIWGSLCNKLGLPETVKQSIVWEYRLHKPDLYLERKVKELLGWLESESAGVAILTDGRSITQRLKAEALGLSHLPIYISEEYSSAKPDPARFELIKNTYTGHNFIYVGDNPAKDFLAPNRLGWITFALKGDIKNIHSQDISNLDEHYLPNYWISELEELRKFIC